MLSLFIFSLFLSFSLSSQDLSSEQSNSLPVRALPLRSFEQDIAPHLTAHDARLLLNLLYWSYKRSAQTCIVQREALTSLNQHWKTWQVCAERRFDPSSSVPHDHSAATACASYMRERARFHTIHTTYMQVISTTTAESSYTSPRLFEFVQELRSSARLDVANELWNHFSEVREQLQKEFLAHQELLRNHLPLGSSLSPAYKTGDVHDRGIFDIFTSMAAFSFQEFDEIFISRSDQLFGYFITLQQLFNELWTTIETTRANFYRSYFMTVRTYLITHAFPKECFLNLFDEHGMLALGQPTYTLML